MKKFMAIFTRDDVKVKCIVTAVDAKEAEKRICEITGERGFKIKEV